MKVGDLYAYQILPMDSGWEQLPTVDDYVAALLKGEPETQQYEPHSFGASIRKFYGFVDRALNAAKKVGWEGDFRIGPRVCVLPAPYQSAVALAWKQDNDGATFVVSQVELTYLDDDA